MVNELGTRFVGRLYRGGDCYRRRHVSQKRLAGQDLRRGGFVVAIIAWNMFDVHYLIPRESPDYGLTEEQQFEKAMLSNPAFQVIKEQNLS